MDILLWHHVAFCLQDASPERPCVGRNDIRIYRQGRKGVEEPGEGDADADHWSYRLKEEVEGTTNLQREFNNYLDSFRSIVVYAAQVYGFYHEIDRLVDNLGGFTKQLDKHPSNALAVALSAKRNKIYRELIMGSVEIVNDIRLVCLSGNKMTEKERVEIVFGIRPKLKVMNKKLQRLTKAVKYTSMSDIWAEIEEGIHDKADKKTIVKDCMNRWKRNGKIK